MVRVLSTLFKRREAGSRRAPGQLGRLMRDVRGVAALEFGFIAPPFFLLLFSMFEVGLTYTETTRWAQFTSGVSMIRD